MIDRKCIECGETFQVYPSSKKKLCSMKCMGRAQSKRQAGGGNANWKGGEWSKKKRATYNKEYKKNHMSKCVDCKKLCWGERCRACQGILERKKIELVCKWCGEKFSTIPEKKK